MSKGVDMEDLLKLQQKLIPELLEVLKIRYDVLRNIRYHQPIGRRLLASSVNLSERVVRSETDFLKEQNLIDVNTLGMSVTQEGEEVLQGLKLFIGEAKGVHELELEIKELLNIKKAIIIPGNINKDTSLLGEIGKATANYIKSMLKDDIIISLTGGHTVKEVIDNFQKVNKFKNVKIIPARGGMGKDIEIQSNTLVQSLANKLEATYELLHIPDNLSQSAFETLLNEEEIKRTFQMIEHSFMLIHGIGLSKIMCEKRNLPCDIISNIEKSGGVGEAFGHYFNMNGEIVYSMPFIGIPNDRINEVAHMIAVAADINKAKAIISVEKNKTNSVLVTDEATAREIIELLRI
ncbi:sugar-binding domain-containing protein [Clostridium sp.]|uniref:sugar-binding transcriptional regulator n=1 Tax=Clostridium sp. TaxID=1506 RepID=UPI002FCADDB5